MVTQIALGYKAETDTPLREIKTKNVISDMNNTGLKNNKVSNLNIVFIPVTLTFRGDQVSVL